jgi:hypothetical protein
MLINEQKEKTINNHKHVFLTYKELKKTLPYGTIKRSVPEKQRFNLQMKPIIIQIEKEKNRDITPSKIFQNLLHNKNIHLFEGEKENNKKLLSKIKYFYPTPKHSKITSFNNDSLISSTLELKSNTSNNANFVNDCLINSKILSLRNENENETEINSDLNRGKGYFRSTKIDNSFLKNNIYLPSITSRLKNKLPRYKRQINELSIKGIGKYSFNLLNTEQNNKINDKEIILRNRKKIVDTSKSLRNNKTSYNDKTHNISSYKDKKVFNDINNRIKKFILNKNLKTEYDNIIHIKRKNKISE